MATTLQTDHPPRQGWTWQDLLAHQFRYGLELRPHLAGGPPDDLTQIITAYCQHTGDLVVPLVFLRTWAGVHRYGVEGFFARPRRDYFARRREVDRWLVTALSGLPAHVVVRRLPRAVDSE